MAEYSVDLKIDIEGASQDLMDELLEHPLLKERGPAGSWWDGGLSLRFNVESSTPIGACTGASLALRSALKNHDWKLHAVEAEPKEDLKQRLEAEPEAKLLHFLQTGEMPPEWLARVPGEDEEPDFIEEGG